MSTATVPTTAVATPSQGGADQLIEARIEEARRALWWAELIRESLRTLIVASMAVIVWVIVDQWIFSPSVSVRFVACAVLAGWCGRQFFSRILPLLGSSIQPEYAARSLERDMPEIKQALTSYVTLRDQRQQPGLRSRVVRSIGSRVAGRLKTHDALPAEATGTLTWWLVAAAVMALFVVYAALSPKNTMASVGRLVAPLASIESPKRVSISEVLPGDMDAIAGRGIDVSALVDGLVQDELVWCRWHTASRVQETELEFDESEHRFAGSIELDHAAMGKVAYYIEAGDAKSGPYWLSVENVPVVALQSVRYEPPAYTGEVAHTSSSGAITAIDGTKVTIRASTNRAIEKATIEFNPRRLGQTVRATAGTKSLDIDESGTGLSISFPLRSAHGRSAAVQLENYRIRVWDAAEQTNPDPIVYPIRVIADLPPEVSIVMPRKTPKNLPLDGQQVIEVHAMDPDFGLKQVNLTVRRGIDVVAEPSLWSDSVGAKGNQVTEYRFRPTEHGLRVGDVVKVAAVAIDNRQVPEDPSIEPNIARTDAIELRIVESEPLPEQPEGDDGLSAPDDRPASDDQGDQKSQSDTATDKTGQSDQQQNGGGGGKGTSAQQDGNSGQGNQTGENTESGNNSGESGDNTQPQKGSGAGSQTESGDSSGEPKQGDPSGQADSNNSTDPNQSPADNTGQNDNQTPSDSDSQSGQPDSQSNQDPNAGEGNAGGGTDGTSPTEGSRQPNGEPGSGQTPQSDQSDSASDAPPKHDGEAFERIRDYLDKKQQEPSENRGPNEQPSADQGDQSKGQQDQPTESSNQESGEPRDSGSDRERAEGNAQGDDQTGQEQGTGSKASGDPKEETGSSTGNEQSKNDPSTGDQTGPDSNAKDPRESASESNGGSDQQESPQGASKDAQQDPSDQESPNGQQPDGAENRSDGSQGGDQTDESGNKDSSKSSDPQTPSGTEQGTGDQSKTDQGGDPKDRSDDPGNSENAEPTDQDNSGNEKSSSESANDGESAAKRKGDNSTQPKSDQPQNTGDPSRNASTPPPGTPTQASGDGSGTDDGGEASQPPPAPADLEYTKKATDMVLDYLKETRDKPDSDLLEELNWTEADLKRFADRWQEVRESENSGLPEAEANPDVEEALRSLGMRPQASDAALQNQDKADSLRGIRDSGNRKPPPAALRDVFEAFRRAAGRQ